MFGRKRVHSFDEILKGITDPRKIQEYLILMNIVHLQNIFRLTWYFLLLLQMSKINI